jgi:DNA-directed RNA polymerase specialized sigma24 family protein
MDSDRIMPSLQAIPEERQLVRRAKAGDADAFIELYDVYSDDLYRYVYFRVLSDVAAEAITSQVFRHAWDHLESLGERRSSFIRWVYEIASTQLLIYYKVNLRIDAFDNRFLLASVHDRLNDEVQEQSPGEAPGIRLRLLTGDIEQSRLQTTAALVMRAYLDYLNPRRAAKPSPTFNAYTRSWLVRYVQLHARHRKPSAARELIETSYATLQGAVRSLMPGRPLVPMIQRVSMVYAMLMLALVVTGTARAQSALPGDALYGWKRASEQVWLSVSPDPIGTDIVLADRRLDEWMAVQKDPARSTTAMHDYMSVLNTLNASGNAQERARVLPLLEAHKKVLKDSGLSSAPVYTYIVAAANSSTASLVAPTALPTLALAATQRPPDSSSVNTTPAPTSEPPTAVEAAPTATEAPTEPPATATEIPTEVVPTPTEVPTEAPTEVIPTATEVPTEVVPPPTDVPTDVPTSVPTDIAPTAMDTPIPIDTLPAPQLLSP